MYFSDNGAKWVEWLTTNWKISGLNFSGSGIQPRL